MICSHDQKSHHLHLSCAGVFMHSTAVQMAVIQPGTKEAVQGLRVGILVLIAILTSFDLEQGIDGHRLYCLRVTLSFLSEVRLSRREQRENNESSKFLLCTNQQLTANLATCGSGSSSSSYFSL